VNSGGTSTHGNAFGIMSLGSLFKAIEEQNWKNGLMQWKRFLVLKHKEQNIELEILIAIKWRGRGKEACNRRLLLDLL